MEWLENPKIELDNENSNTKICTIVFLGGGCIGTGLLCGSLCLLN